MLIACLVVGGTVLGFNDHSVTPEEDRGDEKYWSYQLPGNLTAIWIMIVASVAIIIELTCAPLRLITSRFCGSNFTIVFGILDIVRYTILGLAILMACAGFSGTRQAAYDDADNCDEEYPGDPACDELREFGDNFLASVVISALTLVIIVIGVVWEVIHLVLKIAGIAKARAEDQV
ncbi:uncharacterized protein [Dysidea avara]